MQNEKVTRTYLANFLLDNRQCISKRKDDFGFAQIPGYVDMGVNSYVLKRGLEIWKFYLKHQPLTPQLTYEHVLRYTEIINHSSRLIGQYFLEIPSLNQDCFISINPVNGIVYSQYFNCPVTVSDFITGPDLGFILDGNEQTHSMESTNKSKSTNLPDYFKILRQNESRISRALYNISNRIDEQITHVGWHNIYPCGWNIKAVEDHQQIHLVITDLGICVGEVIGANDHF